MKSLTTTSLFSLFLLCAFTSYLHSVTADLVVDTDGDPIRNGGTYYILPVFRGKGGGTEAAATGNETCPLTVVQSRSELSDGLPVRIESPYRIAYITEGLILDLTFTCPRSCSPIPSKWTIVKDLPEGQAVKLPGYNSTVTGWFHFEKASLNHKIVFCARASGTCGDIGINVDSDGIRRLVVTNPDPFIVKFKKVSSVAA